MRPLRATVLVFMTLSIAAFFASLPAHAGWDYTYGSPGPADYSEFVEVYPTSDGGAILLGQWAGSFEGMDAGESYRLFIQYRNANGEVQWTEDAAGEVDLIPDSTYADDQCTETFRPSGVIDGDDTAFITVAWCTGVDLFIAAHPERGVVTIDKENFRARFSDRIGDIDAGYQSPVLLGASPAGGALFGLYADWNVSDALPAGPVIAAVDHMFDPVWETPVPEDAADLVTFNSSWTWGQAQFAVTDEGGIWIVTWRERPLPHMNDALLLIEIKGDGSLGPTIQHFGFECFAGANQMDIPRVTADSIWVLGCSDGSSEEEGPCCLTVPMAFATDDGRFLGEVGGLSEPWTQGYWKSDLEIVIPDWLDESTWDPSEHDGQSYQTVYDDFVAGYLLADRPSGPYAEYCYDYWEYLNEPDQDNGRGDFCVYVAPGSSVIGELMTFSADGSFAFLDTSPISEVDNIPPFIASWSVTGEGAGVEFTPVAVVAIDTTVQLSDIALLSQESALVVGSTIGSDGVDQRRKIQTYAGNRSGFLAEINLEVPLDKQGAAGGFGTPLRVNIGALDDVPSDAAAVALNITATAAEEWGFVAAYPCASASMSEYPGNSNLNFDAGMTVANSAIVPLDAGYMCLLTYGKSHVILDVSGYFVEGFNPIDGVRPVDTRAGGTG